MAKASDLPTEVWLVIARYLPKSQVVQLKSLNTFFFHCAMDINWKEVKIDTRRAARVLTRMEDPFVASRTRRLTACIRMPKLKEEISASTILVTQLLNVLPLLHNLTFFKIEIIGHISLDRQLLPALCRTITTSPLAKTIEELSLSGHPDMLASLVDSFNVNLSALSISLIGPYEPNNVNILSLARFILSVSPSLQLLRISSGSFNLSPLFSLLSQPLHDSSSLIPFQNLKSLFLFLPFCTSFRSSLQPIRCFLLVHSTNIQHLQLRLEVDRWGIECDDPDEDAEELRTWLSDFVNDISHDSNNRSTTNPSHFFPNLQALDIFSPDTPVGLSAILTFIKRTAPTLSSLIIRRYLNHEEAEQVVYALTEGEISSKLKSLRMNTSDFNLTFLEFLAYKLPQLLTLHLHVKNFSNTSQKEFVMLLRGRRYDVSIKDYCLAAWKLHDLSIRNYHGFEFNDAMAALASVVPSIVLWEDDESSDEE